MFLCVCVSDTVSSHTRHTSYKVITVPSVQTVTSWRSTECPTVYSPPVPVSTAQSETRHSTYRKLHEQRLSPVAKRGWVVCWRKTHILSLLLQKLDLLFICLHITRFSRGFLRGFSSLGAQRTFPLYWSWNMILQMWPVGYRVIKRPLSLPSTHYKLQADKAYVWRMNVLYLLRCAGLHLRPYCRRFLLHWLVFGVWCFSVRCCCGCCRRCSSSDQLLQFLILLPETKVEGHQEQRPFQAFVTLVVQLQGVLWKTLLYPHRKHRISPTRVKD